MLLRFYQRFAPMGGLDARTQMPVQPGQLPPEDLPFPWEGSLPNLVAPSSGSASLPPPISPPSALVRKVGLLQRSILLRLALASCRHPHVTPPVPALRCEGKASLSFATLLKTLLLEVVWTNTVRNRIGQYRQKAGEIEALRALEIGAAKWCKEHCFVNRKYAPFLTCKRRPTTVPGASFMASSTCARHNPLGS